jgi:hypothetical protein
MRNGTHGSGRSVDAPDRWREVPVMLSCALLAVLGIEAAGWMGIRLIRFILGK